MFHVDRTIKNQQNIKEDSQNKFTICCRDMRYKYQINEDEKIMIAAHGGTGYIIDKKKKNDSLISMPFKENREMRWRKRS